MDKKRGDIPNSGVDFDKVFNEMANQNKPLWEYIFGNPLEDSVQKEARNNQQNRIYEKLPNPTINETPAPRNPLQSGVFLLLGFELFIPSVVMGLNWRRMGRGQWVIPTIVTSIVLSALMIISFAQLAITLNGNTFNIKFDKMFLGFIFWATLLAFEICILYLQYGAYKAGNVYGRQAMLNYRYRIPRKKLLIGAVVYLVAAFTIPTWLWYTHRLVTFTYDDVRIIYPADWDRLSENEMAFCTEGDANCFLVISGGEYYPTYMVFFKTSLSRTYSSVEEFEEVQWLYWEDIFPDWMDSITFYEISDDKIGEDNALIRHTRFPDTNNIGETVYRWDIMIIRNDIFYGVNILSNCLGCYRENLDEIQAIYRSITISD